VAPHARGDAMKGETPMQPIEDWNGSARLIVGGKAGEPVICFGGIEHMIPKEEFHGKGGAVRGTVIIDPGQPNEERREFLTIHVNVLILSSPLEHDHPIGTALAREKELLS
jgi:hypothetical protein